MAQCITIISSTYPPEKGAAPSRIYQLAQMLHREGYEISIITAMPNYPTGHIFPGYRGKLWHKETVDGIPVFRTWLYPSNSKSILLRLASMATYTATLFLITFPQLLQNRPDLVIVNTPPFLTGYTGLIMAKLSGSKALLNVSDLWPLSALELGAIKHGRMYRVLEWIEQRMYRLADAFAGQSKDILQHIEAICKKPAFLYYNLQPSLITETQTFVPHEKRRIVYAGLLGIAQGVYDICRNIDFAAIGTELHIYGDGYEKEQIVSYITAHPEKGIFYHDSIPAQEVPAMLQQYDATLIPLRTVIRGALPSKVFMALANGIPVFFSAAGEGASIVSGYGLGWINEPEQYAVLQQNIRDFATLPAEQYNALQQNCRYHALHTFNKTHQDKAFCDFIADLIQVNKSRQ